LGIKTTLTKLETQIAKLKQDISQCVKDASYALNTLKKKDKALLHLKRRQSLVSLLEKREGSARTLEEILDKIDEARTNKDILDAYKAGTAAIRRVTQHMGLTPEAVDDAMIQLSEVMADQNEIDLAFRQGADDIVGPLDTEDLNTELDALMAGEEASSATTLVSPLTQVPSSASSPSRLSAASSLTPNRNRILAPEFPSAPSHSPSRDIEASLGSLSLDSPGKEKKNCARVACRTVNIWFVHIIQVPRTLLKGYQTSPLQMPTRYYLLRW